jgi:hypothetical protein
MREQITVTLETEQLSIRELSLNEMEMVGGGFGLPHINWGGIVHKAEGIVHTAISNIKSHNWNEVKSDAKEGAFWGGLGGAAFGVPEAGVIGALAGADYALAHQDGFV